MAAPPLLLASASPRRLELLAQIGLQPARIAPTDIAETPLPDELPRATALRLARAKSRRAAEAAPDHLCLAADTVVALGRRELPKAASPDDVATCLSRLSGRAHTVFTAVAVSHGETMRHRLVASRVRFKRLSPAEVAAYAQSGEGEGKAGGYAIQGRAAAFVMAVSGSYSGIVGLPLFETASLLESFGLSVRGAP